jgi:hypothetical protein
MTVRKSTGSCSWRAAPPPHRLWKFVAEIGTGNYDFEKVHDLFSAYNELGDTDRFDNLNRMILHSSFPEEPRRIWVDRIIPVLEEPVGCKLYTVTNKLIDPASHSSSLFRQTGVLKLTRIPRPYRLRDFARGSGTALQG